MCLLKAISRLQVMEPVVVQESPVPVPLASGLDLETERAGESETLPPASTVHQGFRRAVIAAAGLNMLPGLRAAASRSSWRTSDREVNREELGLWGQAGL